jgi:hypothetical protein
MATVVRTALAVLLLAATLSAQTIQLEDGAFRVTGWKPESPAAVGTLSSIFAVYTGSEDSPPIFGAYSIEGNEFVFRPRFPLASGVRYRAVFHPADRSPIEAVFDGPKKETTPVARVERVYPSTDVIPANELRLYIFFTAPMSIGEWKKHVHLLDETGKPVGEPFLDIGELWDPSYQRLTVFFDPGRIKRGLIPNLEMGPPVIEGKRYTLVIDREFLDARGVPLVEGFTKSFRGGPAERARIDPKHWRINEPKAGTRDSLTVEFPKPMDYALLARALTIPGAAGSISIDHGEARWIYTPSQPWKAGEYHLDIDLALEDLAGNRIDHVFDIDTLEGSPAPVTGTVVSLPFRIRQ